MEEIWRFALFLDLLSIKLAMHGQIWRKLDFETLIFVVLSRYYANPLLHEL